MLNNIVISFQRNNENLKKHTTSVKNTAKILSLPKSSINFIYI